MDDRIRTAQDIVGLTEVGQVGHDARPVRAAVTGQVDIEDVVAVLAEVAHDPAAGLATPAGHDDPHLSGRP